MENTTQPKKINWIMIILLIVLIPVLLLGYKFISKKMDGNENTNNNAQTNGMIGSNTSSQNSDFPAGTWYRNDPNVNSKYIFDAPQTENVIQKGQLDIVMNDQSEGKVNYEIMGNGKLRISDPQGSFPAWEMGYSYNSEGQSLEITAAGQSATYTRNPVYVAQLNRSQPATASNNSNAGPTKNKVDISKLPPVGFDSKPEDFTGMWSNAHGPGSDKFTVSIEVQQSGNKIDGFIYSDKYNASGNNSSSIQWGIGGDIRGNTANVTIRDNHGNKISSGTLVISPRSMSFSMAGSNSNLPKQAKLTPH